MNVGNKAWLAAATLGVTIAWVASCSDRASNEGCYPQEEYPPEYDGVVSISEGFCAWRHRDIPVDYAVPGEGGGAYSVCFELEPGQTCDACPAEETDQLIKDAFEAECGKDVLGFRRGCFAPQEDDWCCYRALVSPACLDDIH